MNVTQFGETLVGEGLTCLSVLSEEGGRQGLNLRYVWDLCQWPSGGRAFCLCPLSKTVPTPVPDLMVFLSLAGPGVGPGKNLARQLLEVVTAEHCSMRPRFANVIMASSSAWVPLGGEQNCSALSVDSASPQRCR